MAAHETNIALKNAYAAWRERDFSRQGQFADFLELRDRLNDAFDRSASKFVDGSARRASQIEALAESARRSGSVVASISYLADAAIALSREIVG